MIKDKRIKRRNLLRAAVALVACAILFCGCSRNREEDLSVAYANPQSVHAEEESYALESSIAAGFYSDAETAENVQETAAEPSLKVNEDSGQNDDTGDGLSVLFLDVGQADAALIGSGGHYMLIDGGNKSDSDLIYSLLKKNGISHLDIIVATHIHEDHIGGLPSAFVACQVEKVLCPKTESLDKNFLELKKYAEWIRGGKIEVPAIGDVYDLGNAKITILGVNASGSDDENDTSIVLRIDYGSISFLFMGDAEWAAEQVILASGQNLEATVLKVGHHGSSSSTSYQFLKEVMPVYSVISVGEGNSYGHPSEKVLSRLEDAESEIYRTDYYGDILMTTDGTVINIETEHR